MIEILDLDDIPEILQNVNSDAEKSYLSSPEWKKNLQLGDMFVSISRYCAIYGVLKDPLQGWKNQYENEDSEIEYDFEVKASRDNRERGFLFSSCYSVMCPSGELGDTHCSRIYARLRKEQFRIAEKQDWPERLETLLANPVFGAKTTVVNPTGFLE